MKFSVPTNWQKDLVSNIRVDCIEDLYGQLASDFIGGGRASYALPSISKKNVIAQIQEIHKNGMRFNYLLNASCLDNKEWTASGQKRIRKFLDWLVEIKVDIVTVTIPYLLELIKRQYPNLKVYVSTLAGVNSIERAKYWEDLGADGIGLFGQDVNRDFALLKQIRKEIKCQLFLIPNNSCLYRCPFFIYHGILTSHASQIDHRTKGYMIDYCRISCDYKKIAEPINLIRADWIRPEDIHYYEDIGIDKIKLVDRSMTTERIKLIVQAYTERFYDGNLLDLFPFPSRSIAFLNSNPFHKVRYFFRPFSVNLFKLIKGKSLLGEDIKIYIENRKLDGFLEKFLKESCNLKSCRECSYCEDIAKEVVKIDHTYYQNTITNYRSFLDSIISSEIFRM